MTRVKELTVGQVYRNRNRNGYRYLEDVEPEVVKLERVSDGGCYWRAESACTRTGVLSESGP